MERSVIAKPYDYPQTPHVRRHGPEGWTSYKRYRPWLRDEFAFRCVYCLEREVWQDMRRAMHIDHFEPQKLRPDLASDYTNLLYLCTACNVLKGTSLLPDPGVYALAECVAVRDDGQIEAIDSEGVGQLIIDRLCLNDPRAREHRRLWLAIIRCCADNDPSLYVQLMSYPLDLPDLRDPDNTPPFNTKPDGIAESYWERRRRGELPEVY